MARIRNPETCELARRAAAIAGAALAVATATPAHARSHSFYSLSLVVPLYAGPHYSAPYYGPYYGPTYYAPPPVVVLQAPTCRGGLWRQDDGSVVRGVACLYADGYWRLAN